MIESTISKKGQTTLPKQVRTALGLNTGDRVKYVITDYGVRILPARPLSSLHGMVEYDGPAVSVADMDEAIAKGVNARCSQ